MDRVRKLSIPPWEVHVCRPFVENVAELELDRAKCIDDLCERHPSRYRGRSDTAILSAEGCDVRFHLRPFCHGGAFASLTGRRLASLGRPLAELYLTDELRSRAASVPEPAFVMGRKVGLFWEAAVCTVHQEDSLDGVDFLDQNPAPESLRAASRAAGAAIRHFHDAGCRHADLHIKNLLICRREREDDSTLEVSIIDLDGARLSADVPPRRRMQEVMRLYRSLLKLDLQLASSPEVLAVFLSAYTAGDRVLRKAMLKHLPREQRRIRAHSLFYRQGGGNS
jgi:hypothetical protein